MQNAIHSFEVRAISDSGVSRHPTETGDSIHYMTFSIIHDKWALPVSTCFNVSVNRGLAACIRWPPPWSTSITDSFSTFFHILSMWHMQWNCLPRGISQEDESVGGSRSLSVHPSCRLQLFKAAASSLTLSSHLLYAFSFCCFGDPDNKWHTQPPLKKVQ